MYSDIIFQISVRPTCHYFLCILTLSVGVGIFANNNPAANNSVLLADRNNHIGTIYCSTGSHMNNVGQWFSPDGSLIETNNDRFSVVHGGGYFPAYAGLQLKSGRRVTEFDEGIYTCVIPDKNDVEQRLLIGIFRYGTNRK